jgi:hypothetical protein
VPSPLPFHHVYIIELGVSKTRYTNQSIENLSADHFFCYGFAYTVSASNRCYCIETTSSYVGELSGEHVSVFFIYINALQALTLLVSNPFLSALKPLIRVIRGFLLSRGNRRGNFSPEDERGGTGLHTGYT